MKTIIIYNSQTGFTKRYAQWLAEATDAECLELEDAKKHTYDNYDAIVFGGWACAGGISKLKWFKSHMDQWEGKKLAVFCVGGGPADNPDISKALRGNFNDAQWERVKVFYCPGGFNYEKMSATSKMMMKIFIKALRAKKDKTEEEKGMVDMLSHSYDISDKKYIEPILEYLNDR